MKRTEIIGIAIILLFFVALRFANLFFIWFAIFVLLMVYGSKWWLRYMYNQLDGRIMLHTHRMFPGESVTGELILENRGIFPLFGVGVILNYWKTTPIVSDYLKAVEKDLKSHQLSYIGRFNIGRKQRMVVPFTITGLHRGAYPFRELTLELTDLLGLEKQEKRISLFEELLIYPTEIFLQGLEQTHRHPQGETVVKRWIQDDIFFPIGSRPYQFGDSFNRIDFKSTAKLQKLHTKKFDFTAHADICVIANLLTSSYKWIFEEDHFERTLSIVSRLARESLERDLRFSFFANSQAGKGMRVFEIPSSSGRHHFRKVLEVLARFSVFHATPFTLALSKVRQRYPNGTVAVLVTSYLDDEMIKEMNLLVKQGFEIYIVNSVDEIPQISHWSRTAKKERGARIG